MADRIERKSGLSSPRQRLLLMMQAINYGRIEGLMIHRGEPILDPLPRMVRQYKFGGENGPRLEVNQDDFALKTHVVELFTQMETLGSGTIDALEIQRGLPFRMTVEGVPA